MLKNYQSDFTKFINTYLDENPEIQKKQIENRRTWWDKKRDFEFEKLKKSKLSPKKTIRVLLVLLFFFIIQPFKLSFLFPFNSSTICIIKN